MNGSTETSVADLTAKVRDLYVERKRKVHFELTGTDLPPSRFPDDTIAVRPPLRPAKGFGVTDASAIYWLGHCSELSGRMDDFDHETRRGYTIACKLLGLSWHYTQWAIGAARSAGIEKAAQVWAPYMSAPDNRYVGHVYVARRADGVGPVKVGFSTNVAKRMKRLTMIVGYPVDVLVTHPGTMLIEWALHMEMGAPYERAEWYLPDQIPEWLCPNLNRRAA